MYRNSVLDQVAMTKRPLSGKMDVLEQLLDLICYEKVRRATFLPPDNNIYTLHPTHSTPQQYDSGNDILIIMNNNDCWLTSFLFPVNNNIL